MSAPSAPRRTFGHDGQMRLLTFGHGTAGREVLTALLHTADAGEVVDVRRFPGSRRNPDVASDAMARWLPRAGIDYRWDQRLGGRRRIGDADNPEADRWWRVEQFRAYAAHMRTVEFGEAMGALLRDLRSGERPTLIMCSESLWWRCHRRLIADAAVLLHGVDVQHLGHDGRLTAHRPSGGARITEQGLVYDRETPAS